MKLFVTTAIALVAMTSAPAVAQQSYGAQASQPQQTTAQQGQASPPAAASMPQPSAKARKAIVDLQTAVNANDTANIPAKLAAAKAAASTKEDRYWIAVNQLKAADKGHDLASESAALDDLAGTGLMPPSQLASVYGQVGAAYYNAKQYDQASAKLQRAAELNPQDANVLQMLSQAYLAQGNKAQASATLAKVMQMSTAAGSKPEESVYKNAVVMAYEAKSPNAVDLGRQWVAAYPTPDSWHNAIAIYRNLDHPDSAYAVDIMRLSRATDSMQGASDYHLYAYETSDQGNYGEAKAVVAEGLASGKIKANDPIVQEIQGGLKGKSAPTAAELEAAEKGAREPQAFLRVGDRYYGAGNYAKAADLYRQALAKGVDKNLANLRIGEALARSGDKAGATAAFNSVSGPLSDIAKFWLIYVQHSA